MRLTASWAQPPFQDEHVLGELVQLFGPESTPTAFELLQSKALPALVKLEHFSMHVMFYRNTDTSRSRRTPSSGAVPIALQRSATLQGKRTSRQTSRHCCTPFMQP